MLNSAQRISLETYDDRGVRSTIHAAVPMLFHIPQKYKLVNRASIVTNAKQVHDTWTRKHSANKA